MGIGHSIVQGGGGLSLEDVISTVLGQFRHRQFKMAAISETTIRASGSTRDDNCDQTRFSGVADSVFGWPFWKRFGDIEHPPSGRCRKGVLSGRYETNARWAHRNPFFFDARF